jgi:hypothetical protein
MTLPAFEVVEPDHAVYAEIARRFDAYNSAHAGWNWTSFSLLLREGGRIVAAARGVANVGMVEIRGLWVKPDGRARASGAAPSPHSRSMRRGAAVPARHSTATASRRPPSHARLGCREWGKLDYPAGTARHFFVKDLQ